MLKTKKELEMVVISLLSFFTLRDLKISPLFKELEMWSEFTEQHSDSTTIKDNSMLAFSIIVHGLSTLQKPTLTIMLHMLTQANTTHLKNQKPLSYKTQRNGLLNMSKTTMLFQVICLFLSAKYKAQRETLTVSLRFSTFTS